jgi:hypothetical protein
VQQVFAPDGRLWTVRRVIFPWSPRLRLFDTSCLAQFSDLPLDDFLVGLAALVLIIVLAYSLGPIAGVALFGFEWLLVFLAIPLLAMWRILARRPWPILVESSDERISFAVAGWFGSGSAMRRIADHIKATGWPPSDPTR